MAIVSKITGGMIAKGKGKIDYYMLRGILPVARSWPKRRETPFRPRELEAQGVFGILSKSTTFIQDKVREAWIVESIGKRPRWQDTFIGLGMKYWGINKEIPPILLDYQINWHTPNPELELLLQKIEAKYGKTEAQEIQTTGIVNIEDIEEYREKLYFTIYNTKGIRLIAPFLEFIIGKNIDFTIWLQKLTGLIEEPMQVCFTEANVRIPKEKTYFYHGVKYGCVVEFDPKPFKCLPIEKKPVFEWEEDRANWVSPTGFIDPNEDPTTWYNEEKAYDGYKGIFAIGNIRLDNGGTEAWGTFIWYTHTDMACKKVRIWCNIVNFVDIIDINAYFNDTWNLVYRGPFPFGEWFVKELVPPQIISAFRFRFHATCDDWIEWINGISCLIGEVEFYGYIL